MQQLTTQYRTILMKLSWEIQKKKHTSRSKSLQSAWAITKNDEVVVYHLDRKHSTKQSMQKPIDTNSFQLFS